MPKRKAFRLVYVEWADSSGCSSNWETISDNVNMTPLVCASVGWLVQDDKRCKVIVPHLTAINRPDVKQQGCGDMTIPTSAVIKMVTLKVRRNHAR